jgi:threonine synthase
VHCLSVDGTFDDCQDFVKALFADPEANSTLRLAAVNSINWARILAQITYYFASYFSLIRSGTFNPSTSQIRFVVPTGNFGDILAGYFAKRMGLPISELVIATNENDILHRFWETGAYEKHAVRGAAAEGGLAEDGVKAHPEGVKETLSPAMDILVSSNFERLLWILAHDVYGSSLSTSQEKRAAAGSKVKEWQTDLKTKGGFSVEKKVLDAAKANFASERVSDEETVAAIRDVYRWPKTPGEKGYILDPHSAIGVAAALRAAKATPDVVNVALATAHPAKFSHAVEMALEKEDGFKFDDVLPEEFVGLKDLERRLTHVRKGDGLEGLRKLIVDEVNKELKSL